MSSTRFFPKAPIGKSAVEVTFIEVKELESRGASDKEALVTIIEIGDYGCPDCLEVENWTKAILKDLPETRLFFIPSSSQKRPAGVIHGKVAIDALSAGKFWAAHRLLWKNFRDDDDTTIAAIRRTLRIEETQDAELKGNQIYENAGLSWVPTFFVNGIPYFGVDPEPLRKLVDDQLDFAKSVIAEKKLKGNKLYKELVKRNSES